MDTTKEKATSSIEEDIELDDGANAGECSGEDDEFFFESDHLALRGNADYRAVLRTIVILEAQRIEATKHIDRIAEVQRDAMRNPEEFLNRLQSGQSLELPGRISIQELPEINFGKYNVVLPSEAIQTQTGGAESSKQTDQNEVTVRGRAFDVSKPGTFNQLWSCEEQRRLEELLTEFPPEPVEMRRFAKIAKALGNRTTRQVASRLQKYFQKLHAAGLPVPGRVPRHARTVGPRKNRMQKHMIRPTTFFPSNFVPVNMPDDDENNARALDPSFYRNGCQRFLENLNFSSQRSEDDTVVVDVPSDGEISAAEASDEVKMVRLVRRVKRDKEKKYPIEISTCDHSGFSCDFCSEEPIVGTRWHCSTCNNDSIDFCGDCLIAQLQSEDRHPLDHRLIGLRVATEFKTNFDSDDSDDDNEEDEMSNGDAKESKPKTDSDESNQISVFDEDYLPQKSVPLAGASYNYMDTNFLPQ